MEPPNVACVRDPGTINLWGFWKDPGSDPFWKPTMVHGSLVTRTGRCQIQIPFNAIRDQSLPTSSVQVVSTFGVDQSIRYWNRVAFWWHRLLWESESHIFPSWIRWRCFFFIVIACLVSWSLSSCLRSLGFDEVSEQGYISLSHHCQNFDGLQDK